MGSFEILNFLVICGLVIAALCVLEFLILKAPDVALAEAAVGAILTPVIFIITLNKVKTKEGEKCKKE